LRSCKQKRSGKEWGQKPSKFETVGGQSMENPKKERKWGSPRTRKKSKSGLKYIGECGWRFLTRGDQGCNTNGTSMGWAGGWSSCALRGHYVKHQRKKGWSSGMRKEMKKPLGSFVNTGGSNRGNKNQSEKKRVQKKKKLGFTGHGLQTNKEKKG